MRSPEKEWSVGQSYLLTGPITCDGRQSELPSPPERNNRARIRVTQLFPADAQPLILRRMPATLLSPARPSRRPQPGRISASGRARDVLDFIAARSTRYHVSYPFPVDDQFVAHLHLPADGLSRSEADRLKLYVDALVTD